MFIFKQPFIGGDVGLHQDSTFLHTHKHKLLGMWIALDDATEKNGCLWGIPGPTPTEPVQLFCRSKDDSTYFTEKKADGFEVEKLIPLPVKKGSVILFSGLFPHMSKKNRSEKPRNAYTLHFIDALDEYPATNWLQQ